MKKSTSVGVIALSLLASAVVAKYLKGAYTERQANNMTKKRLTHELKHLNDSA